MRTRRSPRNQESMLHIVSGIKDKQALIMNNAKQRERIAQLEAENAALRAELSKMSVEAIAYKTCLGHYDSLTDELTDALTAARQSRARLVRLVRELQDWRTLAYKYHRICLKAESERDAARAWAAAWKRRAKAHRDNAKHLDREADALYKSCNEARAWAAAWRKAAIEYRSQVRMFKSAIKDNAWHSEYRRATRAAARRFADTRRAAEAMERR